MDSPRPDIASEISERRGVKCSSPGQSIEGVDEAQEAIDSQNVPLKVMHISVRERVIFCLDAHFYKPMEQRYIYDFIMLYMDIKKRISVKPVEFGILLMCDGSTSYVPVTSKKQVNNVMVAMYELQLEEKGAFDFSKVFRDLAEMIELPDPSFHTEDLPPPHVYHFIILFGRSKFVPKLDDSNPYYFLMDSPFVGLDILYLITSETKGDLSRKITLALKGLHDENKGFFEVCTASGEPKMTRAIAQFSGHVLLRFPQKSAVFDFRRLPAQLKG